jgi:tetratricopeptide (TPR) repeat protein
LLDLGRASEALALIEQAIQVYEALPSAEQRSRRPRAQRNSLYWLHWEVLSAMGDPASALKVAQHGRRLDGGMRWPVLRSLLELDRFDEAERVDGTELEPREYAQVLWDIAFHLVEQERYETALPYFLRNLAFRRVPEEFRYLQAYLECLGFAGRYEELAIIAGHWLNSSRVRRRPPRRLLQALLTVAQARRGKRDAARESAAMVCEGRPLDRCLQLFRGRYVFEETAQAIRGALADALEQQT